MSKTENLHPLKTSPINMDIVDNNEYFSLSVNWEVNGSDYNELKDWEVVFHYTDKNNVEPDFHHLTLDQEQAKKLHTWLGKFLKRVNGVEE